MFIIQKMLDERTEKAGELLRATGVMHVLSLMKA